MNNEILEVVMNIIFIGIGATCFMDLWSVFMKITFGIQGLNYEMVGRWIGHIPKGKFWHERIDHAKKVKRERFIGWFTHYVIGIKFSALIVFIWGEQWISDPSFVPSLLVGLITVLAPFLILQPALGAGIFARKTPNPNVNRLKSLMAHTSYGIGLYIAAKSLNT